MVEATAASEASGAMAAPTLAHPMVINCKLPPNITPSSRWPVTKPIREQATTGW